MNNAATASHSIVGGFVALMILMVMYFGPTIVALTRKHRSVMQIALVNFFFGWTVIGWLIAFIWAFGAPQTSQQTIVVHAVGAVHHAPAAPVPQEPPASA